MLQNYKWENVMWHKKKTLSICISSSTPPVRSTAALRGWASNCFSCKPQTFQKQQVEVVKLCEGVPQVPLHLDSGADGVAGTCWPCPHLCFCTGTYNEHIYGPIIAFNYDLHDESSAIHPGNQWHPYSSVSPCRFLLTQVFQPLCFSLWQPLQWHSAIM